MFCYNEYETAASFVATDEYIFTENINKYELVSILIFPSIRNTTECMMSELLRSFKVHRKTHALLLSAHLFGFL